MASNRMSAALSVLMPRNFSEMLLRARQALAFLHSRDPKRANMSPTLTRMWDNSVHGQLPTSSIYGIRHFAVYMLQQQRQNKYRVINSE